MSGISRTAQPGPAACLDSRRAYSLRPTESIRIGAEDCSSAVLERVARGSKELEDRLTTARKELAGLDHKNSAIRKPRVLKAKPVSTGAELAREAARAKLSALARGTARMWLEFNPGNPVVTTRTASGPAVTRSTICTQPAAPRLQRRNSRWAQATFEARFAGLAIPLGTSFAYSYSATS